MNIIFLVNCNALVWTDIFVCKLRKPTCPLKSKRKIISGWQLKLTGQRVSIHSNYAAILSVTLALLL